MESVVSIRGAKLYNAPLDLVYLTTSRHFMHYLLASGCPNLRAGSRRGPVHAAE